MNQLKKNGLRLFLLLGCSWIVQGCSSRVTVWDGPSEALASKDYRITLKQKGKTYPLFTYYTYNREVDKAIDKDGKYVKHSLFNLHANEYKGPENNPDTYAHSWAAFDFDGGPVEVEVTLNENTPGITFPLESCGIYPSNLGIECQVVNGNTVRFTLDKPAKFALVPNDKKARELVLNNPRAYEGYRNPCFIFARAPQENVPDKEDKNTLVVKPGEWFTPEDFAKYQTIYFEPGVHDYSKFNPADTNHYIYLKPGQQMYLAGGAYVYGHVSSDDSLEIAQMPKLFGRGTMSGVKNIWTGVPRFTCEVRNVWIEGIQIADAHNHISHSSSPFIDVAVVGAWHGNTDGITVEYGTIDDPYDGWNVKDCFVMGGDSNLKFRGIAKIKNYTVWQLGNAEPFWAAPVDNINPLWKEALVEDIQVICYNKSGSKSGSNPGQVINMATEDLRYTGKAKKAFTNVTVKNFLCDAPFVSRIFTFQNHIPGDIPIYENVVYENVTVNTPVIQLESVFGQRTPDCAPLGTVIFKNLVINGVKVTAENCTDYFDFLYGVEIGKNIIFE